MPMSENSDSTLIISTTSRLPSARSSMPVSRSPLTRRVCTIATRLPPLMASSSAATTLRRMVASMFGMMSVAHTVPVAPTASAAARV